MRFLLPTFKGRTGRKSYAWVVVVSYLAGWALEAPGRIAFRSLDGSFPPGDLPERWRGIVWPHDVALAAAIILCLVVLWLVIALLAMSVRRLHDIDLSGWFILVWALIFLLLPDKAIPSDYATTIRDAVLFGILILVPGTRGPNAFGPDPNATEPVATPAVDRDAA